MVLFRQIPEGIMLVQVNWTNDRYDYVKDFMLEGLIQAGVVARFLRKTGWVTIGVDPVRSSTPKREYDGSERRLKSPHPVAC
jgi:hypothetical protein